MQSRLSIFYLQPYSARPECPRCSISYHCPLKCGSEESSPLSLHKNSTKTPSPKVATEQMQPGTTVQGICPYSK